VVLHRCPICGVRHEVRQARAEVAYGRQLTCSPECESERRRRRRHRPFRPLVAAERASPPGPWARLCRHVAQTMHVWTRARAAADLALTELHRARAHPVARVTIR
jgi:hypothetical protein